MKVVPQFLDGWHYWARHFDGSTFVVKLEDGRWYAPGVDGALGDEFQPARQVIKPIEQPVH